MSVLSRLSIYNSDHDCSIYNSDHDCFAGGKALPAGKRQQSAIDLDAAYLRPRNAVFSLVDFRPPGIFRRQIAAWRGLGGELTHTLRREPFEVRYNGAWHLLVAYESAQRLDGETIIDGLPRSTLRDSPASSSSFRRAWVFASGRTRAAS
jgi:hypothetical protein